MPINKNQWERFRFILSMMRKRNKYVNYPTYMAEMAFTDPDFYVSPKTFTRDIAALQDLFDAPIEYSRRKRGYFLTDPVWTISNIPSSKIDMKLLLLSQQISRVFLPQGLRKELNSTIDTLFMNCGRAIPENMTLDDFKIISNSYAPPIDRQIFMQIYQAWENKNYLKIVTSSDGEPYEHHIQPYSLAWDEGIWYVKGCIVRKNGALCPTPFDICSFALHKIEKAEKLSGTFIPDDDDVKRINKSEADDSQNIEELEIEFRSSSVKKLVKRFTFGNGEIISQTRDTATVKFTNISKHAALQLIFQAEGNAKIIKPANLQETLLKTAANILAQSN